MNQLMSLILLFFTGFFSHANTIGLRGGGSECVKRFINYGTIISKHIDAIPADQSKLLSAIQNAEIVTVDTEYIVIEGEQFYAINEPLKSKITVSQKWCKDSLYPKLANTAIIVLHEYLGLSQPGLDKNYSVSNRVHDYTNLNPEEMYYLELTNGLDRSIITTNTFSKVLSISPTHLSLTHLQFPEKTAELTCDIELGSQLYLETRFENKSVGNYYEVTSYDYCINKMYEFINKHDGIFGLSFVIGLNSNTVYEINFTK